MPHQLDFLEKKHILNAIREIDKTGVPINNQWSEYWIYFQGKYYQFKYAVELASTFAKKTTKTNDLTSNESSRNFIARLGFRIVYKSPNVKNLKTNHWVVASFHGNKGKQFDKHDDFIANKFWSTDHDKKTKEGAQVYNELQKVQINDRICIRYFDRKQGTVKIAATGTVSENVSINEGRLNIVWDYNFKEYYVPKPSGAGSGNWWKTLFQIKKHKDIETIFGEKLIEKRISRLTYNEHGWIMPSGKYGKSKSKKTHEGKHGYGHEEWLFDISKQIEGYHYAFLEPIYKTHSAFEGNTYDLWLYSINLDNKKRYWIGEIKNVIVIDSEEAEKIKKVYSKNGWLKEMSQQLKIKNIDGKEFLKSKAISLFNIKFKSEDLLENDPYFDLPSNHQINEQSRYTFAHLLDEHLIDAIPLKGKFTFKKSPKLSELKGKRQRNKFYREPKAIEMLDLHYELCHSLTMFLKNKYGNDHVTWEHPTGYGANRIDIVAELPGKRVFYEIKTYNSIKTSIREALGQLLEYCFYPDEEKAQELIIVTQWSAEDETKLYFQHLRKTFNMNIYYQSYDKDTKQLSEKY